MSGRDMFLFNPSLVAVDTEDDEEGGDFDLNMREKEEDIGVKVSGPMARNLLVFRAKVQCTFLF